MQPNNGNAQADCLRKLDDHGRESVAIWICEKLKGAEGQASTLWRERVQPWLDSAWPREPQFRGAAASVRLAWAATLAGDAFVEAAHCVSQLIGPSIHAGMVLNEIEEKGLAATAPEACLELVNPLVGEQPPNWYGDLRAFLDAVVAAQPTLATDLRYRGLREISIRIGQ